ncbi:MAG TPA: hypothetical protein DDW85_14065 [Porphyromonadaceae bacterium]|nr:hypothetical protein [Porphyromonadaceae bacterium]
MLQKYTKQSIMQYKVPIIFINFKLFNNIRRSQAVPNIKTKYFAWNKTLCIGTGKKNILFS